MWGNAHDMHESLWQFLFAGNFGSISIHFVAIHSFAAKNHLKSIFLEFKVIQGHRCWHSKKLVVSACYDKQHVCAYLSPFTR